MPKDEKKEKVEKEDGLTLESVKAQLDDACAKIRRHSDNWVKHMDTYHDSSVGGKVGKAGIATMLITAFVTVVIGMSPIFAYNVDDKSAGTGTYKLDQASQGTGDITLTVDTVDADRLTVNAASGLDNASAGTLLIGAVTATKVEIADSEVETEIQGTLNVTEASTLAVRGTGAITTNAYVLTSANYGQIIVINNSTNTAITLPANGANVGSWIDVAVGSSGDDFTVPTISAATADTLIGPNDEDLDSVTWGTGHRINAYARFWSDGSFWHVQNLGGTTMTYTD